MNPLLVKSYKAGAAVNPCRFVKVGAADYEMLQATDASVALLGITTENIVLAAGQPGDVIKEGLAYLELGGVVARGKWLVPDANGKGVEANIVQGAPLYAGAKAEIAGVAGDIIPVQVVSAVIANDSGIITTDTTITSPQVLALNATPRQVIAAPGAGLAIVLEDAQLYKSAGVAYAGIAAGEDLAFKYTDGAGLQIAQVETTGFLDQATAQHRHVRPTTAAEFNVTANAALVLHLLVGEIITGDQPIKVRTRHRQVAVAF